MLAIRYELLALKRVTVRVCVREVTGHTATCTCPAHIRHT